MREAEKREGRGLSEPPLALIQCGILAKSKQPRLFRVQLQPKLPQPCLELLMEPPRIRFLLESHHEIVRETHNDYVAARFPFPPLLDPEVEDVVEVRFPA
jgi:hypothetical protein